MIAERIYLYIYEISHAYNIDLSSNINNHSLSLNNYTDLKYICINALYYEEKKIIRLF